MNLATLRTRVHHLIAQDPLNPEFVSDVLVKDALNESIIDFANRSGALEIRQGVSATADQAEYAVPDTVSRIFRVAFDGYPLEPTSQRELDDSDPVYRTNRGIPELWAKDRLDERMFRVTPIPISTGPGMGLDPEIGELVSMTGAATLVLDNELGVVTDLAADGRPVVFDSELGVLISLDVNTNDFDVWAKKTPTLLVADDDAPELPGYAHLGLAYAAAARVLMARTELRNDALAGIYEAAAADYLRHLTRVATTRQPEKVQRAPVRPPFIRSRLNLPLEIPAP